MTGMNILKSFASIFFLLLLCSCRNPDFSGREVPPSLHTPDSFVAVFASDTEIRVYGDRALAEYRFPPCSTFKIISTLMGLDCGVIRNLDSKLGYDGTKYENENWNQDVTLQQAFQYSCVPYYKKLTGRLKKQYVQKVLDELDYGNCDISVWNSNGHNVFWIESSLLISPLEQIGAIRKVISGSSSFSPEHVAMLKKCMYLNPAGQWAFYGKTGTGRNHNRNLLEAWFVGFVENEKGETVYFAAHGADSRRDVSSPEIRDAVRKILENLQ